MTLSSLFLLYGREAWHTANALTEPVYFLSGLYFPIRSLGALGMVAAGVIPLTLGTDALRQVLLGPDAHGLWPLGVEAAALAAFGVLFLWLAGVSMAHLEALAKHEGRLTLRWQ
jgi:ABC-2 type transport system permease protein